MLRNDNTFNPDRTGHEAFEYSFLAILTTSTALRSGCASDDETLDTPVALAKIDRAIDDGVARLAALPEIKFLNSMPRRPANRCSSVSVLAQS